MIEDDELGDDLLLGNPVAAIRQVSHDPTLRQTIMLRDGSRATALEIQWGLLERARKYEQSHGLACVDDAVGRDVLDRWEQVLTGLEADPASVASRARSHRTSSLVRCSVGPARSAANSLAAPTTTCRIS